MNKKMVRNVVLLLLIPVVISIIFSLISLKKNSFSSTVTYENNSIVQKYNIPEAKKEDDVINSLNSNYTFSIFCAISLVILFVVFLIYINKKKGW